MSTIKGLGPKTPRAPKTDLPPPPPQHLDRTPDKVRDAIEKKIGNNPFEPREMKRHIDKVLEGPWGPIDARALYSAPNPDKPEIPRDGKPGWPGDVRALYAVDINPDPIRPRPPEIQPMYGVSIDPKPGDPIPRDGRWPGDIRALYAVDIDPVNIRPPSIRAMYGIDFDDTIQRPIKKA
jgi:hypothetical protein